MTTLGWCTYASEMVDANHLAAVALYKPPVVRWFVPVNWYVNNNNPTTTNWTATYGDAFQTLHDTGTKLIVQFEMYPQNWVSNISGGTLGCSGWRYGGAGSSYSWLADTSASGPWRLFFDSLRSAIDAKGVTAYYGFWNEPDWMSDPFGPSVIPGAGGNAVTTTAPWSEGFIWPKSGMGWSGGWQKMADMRNAYPSLTWTSDGVGYASDGTYGGPGYNWHSLIGPDTSIDVIDVHVYATTIEASLDWIAKVVAPYTAAGRTNLPILIGEYGEQANGTPEENLQGWYERTLLLQEELNGIYPGRMLGIATHSGGTSAGQELFKPLWKVLGDLETGTLPGGPMTDFTDTYEDRILNKALRNTDWTSASTVYLALFDTITNTEVPSGLTEISGTGYSRPSITFGAPSGGTCANTNSITLTNTSGSTWNIGYVAIVASNSAGNTTASNFIMVRAMSKTILNNDAITFGVGSITVAVA